MRPKTSQLTGFGVSKIVGKCRRELNDIPTPSFTIKACNFDIRHSNGRESALRHGAVRICTARDLVDRQGTSFGVVNVIGCKSNLLPNLERA